MRSVTGGAYMGPHLAIRPFTPSVRVRLFVVIAGLGVLAASSMAVAYLTTEPEREDIQTDLRVVAHISGLAADLADAVHEQERAVDDYLLAARSDSVAEYQDATRAEWQAIEHLRLAAQEYLGDRADEPEDAAAPDAVDEFVEDLGSRLDAIEEGSAFWRRQFAELAIRAVDGGSIATVDRVSASAASDHEDVVSAVDEFTDEVTLLQETIVERNDVLAQTRTLAGLIAVAVMLLGSVASLLLLQLWVNVPISRLLQTANDVESGHDIAFPQTGDDEIGRLGQALERMRGTLRGDADRLGVIDRFTEVTTFAPDDTAVAKATLEAVDLLVAPDAAVVHVLNRSKDRAVPEALTGSAVADVLPLSAMSHCPGVVRGNIHVTIDAAAPLSVHCPVYHPTDGTVACVPLAHGELVGAIHLAWHRRDAFPIDDHSSVARIAEHAALAIGNRRLLAALQGMASTDPRTGLANTRSFDTALEDALAARAKDESVAVLMLDLDNFKDFNDRHGHPSGDEALRSFAAVLRSCLRDDDVAARYGGEEFAVLLRSVDHDTALMIAERIRQRTESTVISLAPGVTDRITVSVGVSSAPGDALDRITLLRLADEALYRAKTAGRNRVEFAAAA